MEVTIKFSKEVITAIEGLRKALEGFQEHTPEDAAQQVSPQPQPQPQLQPQLQLQQQPPLQLQLKPQPQLQLPLQPELQPNTLFDPQNVRTINNSAGGATQPQEGLMNPTKQEPFKPYPMPWQKQPQPQLQPQQPTLQQPQPAQPQPQPAQPQQQPPTQQPQPTQQQQQATIPTTLTNGYTFDQLAVAATQLVDAGRREEIVALLQNFGVSALTELAPELYGDFARALREKGARL